MSNKSKKTPAELKAEQVKAQRNAGNQGQEAQEVDFKKESERLGKELGEKVKENEKAIKVQEKSDKRIETLEKENKTLKKNLESATPDESNAIIDIDTLDLDKVSEAKPLNHDVFIVTGSNKSISFGGFTFKKGEEYCVTGRMRNAVNFLIEKKHGKIIKAK